MIDRNETHDGNRDFWTVTILRCTVFAVNEHTGESCELRFRNDGLRGQGDYPSCSAALRALGRTIDNDRRDA